MSNDVKQLRAVDDRELKTAGQAPAQQLTPAERRARVEARALRTINNAIRLQRRRDAWLAERW